MNHLNVKTIEEMNTLGFTMFYETYISYFRDASSFISRCIKGKAFPASTTNTDEAKLIATADFAHDHLVRVESLKRTSDSWRKLRRSLAVFYASINQPAISKKFTETENPTPAALRPKKTGKSRRQTKVTLEDMDTMFSFLREKDEQFCLATIIVGRDLGLRPCEMNDVQIISEDDKEIHLRITGAKKTKLGEIDPELQRGIERDLIADSTAELKEALRICQSMTDKDIKATQAKISRASKKLWPARKRQFSLYSLRYTIGSNLKAQHINDPLGAVKVAATMGHKNVSSASDYGHFLSGTGFGVPRTTAETMERVVIDRNGFEDVRAKIAEYRVKQSQTSAALNF